MNNLFSHLLYAQSSFLAGISRTLDIGGTFDDFNYAETPEEADWLALASDWYAVGADILTATREVRPGPVALAKDNLHDSA